MPAPLSRRRLLEQSGAAIGLYPSLLSLGAPPARPSLNTSIPVETVIGDLQRFIPELMQRMGVPGLSIAIIRDATVVWGQGFGVKSKATRERVDADTIFEAASLSKPTFAYAVLKLCEEGKLSLDTPLVEHLPASLIPDEPRFRRITARHVLSHSSGLPHGRPRGAPIKLRFTPGERFYYSATGFDYLQIAVERVTGQPLEEFMQAQVLEPFGMRRSHFGWLELYRQSAAQGHGDEGEPELSGLGRYLQMSLGEKAQLSRDYPEDRQPSAAAGLYTTANDFARLMIAVIQPSRKDRYRLSERWTKEMLKPQIKITDAVAWGLGWGLQHTDAGDAFWHWGDWGVFRNFAIAYRGENVGVVVLTNSFYGPRAYREIVPRAIGGEHPAFGWVERYRS
jgi:CubicO group peptidase (beta-lactamase class C family)